MCKGVYGALRADSCTTAGRNFLLIQHHTEALWKQKELKSEEIYVPKAVSEITLATSRALTVSIGVFHEQNLDDRSQKIVHMSQKMFCFFSGSTVRFQIRPQVA